MDLHQMGDYGASMPFIRSKPNIVHFCQFAMNREFTNSAKASPSLTVMGGSSGLPFPVLHKKLSLDIKGINTELAICGYDDHFLVIATQIGCMGTMLHARKEEGMSINPTYNVSVMFGKRDEPMLVACARQLIEHISSSGSSKSLVLSLGLKDHSAETLKGIVHAVIENCLW